VDGFWVRRPRIKVPVGSSVTNHSSFDWNSPQRGCEFSDHVVLIDSMGEIWNVDASVALSADKKVVRFVLREFFVPRQKRVEIVFGRSYVIATQILSGISNAIAYSCRAFEPNNVGLLVPGVRVRFDKGLTIIDRNRTILLHES